MKYRIAAGTEVGLWTRAVIDARVAARRNKMACGNTMGRRRTDREVVFDDADVFSSNYISNAALNPQMHMWFRLPIDQHGANVISVPHNKVYAEP